ncbi:hypothetical protein GGI20_006233, partial [Coemansia sp. BCRC 34301]
YVVYLAINKRLGEAKHTLEWVAFYSQALFDSVPKADALNKGIKCYMLMTGVAFTMTLITLQSRYPITGSHVMVLFGIVPVSLVFFIHTIMPYGGMLGLYAAV